MVPSEKDRLNLRMVWKKSPPDQLEEYLGSNGQQTRFKSHVGVLSGELQSVEEGQGCRPMGTSTLQPFSFGERKDIAIGRTRRRRNGQVHERAVRLH